MISDKLFFADPGTTATLTTTLDEGATLSSSDTEITVTSAVNFPSTGRITINSETILYTGKSGSTLTGCHRGYNNTIATTHADGTTVVLIARTAQNPHGTDQHHAGWYKDRGSSNKSLRLNDSDLMMSGIVRFNRDNNIFQGYNGSEWVTFNAVQGDAGPAGADANETFTFINLPEGGDNDGEIYKEVSGTDIHLRTIRSGTFDLNAGVTGLNALGINKGSEYLTLTPTPRPYVWDFSTNETSSISFLKSGSGDTKFKAFGQVSKWKVKAGATVTVGSAVRVTLSAAGSGYTESTTYLVIEPYTYSSLIQETREGAGFLGIALENKSNGQTCEVCTDGVTTILLGDGDGAGNQTSGNINGPGAYGFVGYDGQIYNESISTGISANTPVAGYWLERGGFATGDEVLFYVKGGFSFT
jgi:hypothetical protein